MPPFTMIPHMDTIRTLVKTNLIYPINALVVNILNR